MGFVDTLGYVEFKIISTYLVIVDLSLSRSKVNTGRKKELLAKLIKFTKITT